MNRSTVHVKTAKLVQLQLPPMSVPPLLVASFDIECYSQTGDFPKATNREDRITMIGVYSRARTTRRTRMCSCSRRCPARRSKAGTFSNGPSHTASTCATWTRLGASDVEVLEVATYCVCDVELPFRLMHSLSLLLNKLAESETVNTTLSDLVTRGQGIKIFSYIAQLVKCVKDPYPSRCHLQPYLKKQVGSDRAAAAAMSPAGGGPRLCAKPTRLFALCVISLLALLIMHNALNIDLAEQTSRRPGLLARRIQPTMTQPFDGGGAVRRGTLAVSAARPEGVSQPIALARASSLVNEPPWTTAIAPARPFNYSDCTTRPGSLGPTRALEYIVSPDDPSGFPTGCEREELKKLCEIVGRVALNREVLTAVCNSKIIGQLETFLEVGCSVLMSDIDIVWVRNPFDNMWRDTDLEGATDGWDAETAYGWTERLDDVTMGTTVEGYRITAFNSGLWYLQATHEHLCFILSNTHVRLRGGHFSNSSSLKLQAVCWHTAWRQGTQYNITIMYECGLRMMTLLAHRMETEDTWDQTAFSQEATLGTHDGWLNWHYYE
ncbi:hypothetical protein T492DRAFT_1130201 [Pavlovales sp. CCMP2436]|nr:hypothetical protein T492DRAFT_1130201 [Pavlovales sp. CCMP2436]